MEVGADSLSIVTTTPEAERPAAARAYVPLPADYLQLDDEDAVPIDEAIVDALMEQLGIEDEK